MHVFALLRKAGRDAAQGTLKSKFFGPLRRCAAAAAFLVLLLLTPALALEVKVDQKYPVRAQPVTLTVSADGQPVSGAEVEALYTPNSKVEKKTPLGKTDAEGKLQWSPERAGLVTLSASSGDQSGSSVVSVRFDKFPPSGLGTMLFAGCLLFGGIIFGFMLVLGGDDTPEPLMDT